MGGRPSHRAICTHASHFSSTNRVYASSRVQSTATATATATAVSMSHPGGARGVTLAEMKKDHKGEYEFGKTSIEDNLERFKQFSAVVLNSRGFVDKGLAMHLPLDSGKDARDLTPLVNFIELTYSMDTFLDNRVISCYLPQLSALNNHNDANNPLGPRRDSHFEFCSGDDPKNQSRVLDLWNQMGGDMMIVMAAMRLMQMSMCDDRPDGLNGNSDDYQLEETANTLNRIQAMTLSELAVRARSTIVTQRQKAIEAGEHKTMPKDFRLSAELKHNVFAPLDELSAMSSLQFGCCQQTRSVIAGMDKLKNADALLEVTMKQSCEDTNMQWFRYHLRSEMRRAAHDVYGFAEGTSTSDKDLKEDVSVGLDRGSPLRPPWIDRGEKLGEWRAEGCHVVIVPVLHSSLAASTIVGAGIIPGSLVTSSLAPNGSVEERRLRTPVAFCFVDGRGRVLDRSSLRAKGVHLQMPPLDPNHDSTDSTHNPINHNVFFSDCGTHLMLALGHACKLAGTVFVTP